MVTRSVFYQSLRPRLAGAALALTIGLSGTAAVAQDATPSPAEGVVCATESATPIASPGASPAATAIPVTEELQGETVEDEALISEITDVALACNPDASGGIEVEEVVQYDTNLYGIEYQYQQGAQVIRVLETYSMENGTWTLRQQQAQAPETDEDTITIGVSVGGDPPLEISPGSFAETPAARFRITSSDSADLGVALFSASGEVDTEALAGTSVDALPETLTLEGKTSVVAGTTEEMLFEGLKEGNYVIAVLDGSDTVTAATPLTIDPPADLGL